MHLCSYQLPFADAECVLVCHKRGDLGYFHMMERNTDVMLILLYINKGTPVNFTAAQLKDLKRSHNNGPINNQNIFSLARTVKWASKCSNFIN